MKKFYFGGLLSILGAVLACSFALGSAALAGNGAQLEISIETLSPDRSLYSFVDAGKVEIELQALRDSASYLAIVATGQEKHAFTGGGSIDHVTDKRIAAFRDTVPIVSHRHLYRQVIAGS